MLTFFFQIPLLPIYVRYTVSRKEKETIRNDGVRHSVILSEVQYIILISDIYYDVFKSTFFSLFRVVAKRWLSCVVICLMCLVL